MSLHESTMDLVFIKRLIVSAFFTERFKYYHSHKTFSDGLQIITVINI